jgi:hypothetical protein
MKNAIFWTLCLSLTVTFATDCKNPIRKWDCNICPLNQTDPSNSCSADTDMDGIPDNRTAFQQIPNTGVTSEVEDNADAEKRCEEIWTDSSVSKCQCSEVTT